MGKIKVLVVDDSSLMRKIISDAINTDPELEVVDQAKDSKEALEKIFTLNPDVVTLDVNLPLIDGLSVLEEVMKKQPTRVIMVSAYTREGTSATIRALELGAVDFIVKPSGEISLDIYKLKDEIISKIKLAAKVDLEKTTLSYSAVVLLRKKELRAPTLKKLVIIGASTGGPRVILDIMQGILPGLAASFIIVQHMPRNFTNSFAERISWQSGVKSKEAEDGDLVLAGKAFVAPGGYHLVIQKEQGQLKLKLTRDAPVNFIRPSIDITMASAAEAFGENTIGVILTGMGKDGLEGAKKIKQKGGVIIVQNKESSVVWGMPRVVYEAGLADKVLPVSEITQAIIDYI